VYGGPSAVSDRKIPPNIRVPISATIVLRRLIPDRHPALLSEPLRCYYSTVFADKFVLLALLGIDAPVFHRTIYRSVEQWNGTVAVALATQLLLFRH
jgi:hypothetical protein